MVAATVSTQRKRFRALIIWLLLLVVVGGIVGLEQSGLLDPQVPVDEHGHVANAPKMLLPTTVEQISVVEVSDANDAVHRFERNDDGAWFYHTHESAEAAERPHQHTVDPAQSGLIGQALEVLGRTRIARNVGTGAQGEDYGVTAPIMVIAVYGEDQNRPLARYMVGDLEPDEFRRYVLIFGAFSIVTIPDYQVENLSQLIAAVSADQQ